MSHEGDLYLQKKGSTKDRDHYQLGLQNYEDSSSRFEEKESSLTRIYRRKRRPGQNGVQAIFSGKNQGSGRTHLRFASYEFEDETEQSEDRESRGPTLSKKRGHGSPLRISRILVVAMLTIIMLTTVVGFSDFNSGLQDRTDLGTSGTGTGPPVKAPFSGTMTPSFYAVSNLAEAIVSSSQNYAGNITTSTDDFLIIQIAYSQGTPGNLPDIAAIADTQSNSYSKVAAASPGTAENFWEQVWTTRASSTSNTTRLTMSPDWSGCQTPCVSSIIIAMTVGRYRGVAGVGAATTIAPTNSSTSQSASITPTQPNSTLVELLSHGAYSSCGIDAPQPRAGQTSRNCFTATTERTELFDHSISNTQTVTESYTWSQVEVQRGIYLELKGNSIRI